MGSKSIFGQLVSIGFVVFIVWILLASTPQTRLERACRPVDWTGNLATSTAALVAPSYQQSVTKTFRSIDYSCQYMLWRLFYEDDYKRALKAESDQQNANTSGDETRTDASTIGSNDK